MKNSELTQSADAVYNLGSILAKFYLGALHTFQTGSLSEEQAEKSADHIFQILTVSICSHVSALYQTSTANFSTTTAEVEKIMATLLTQAGGSTH